MTKTTFFSFIFPILLSFTPRPSLSIVLCANQKLELATDDCKNLPFAGKQIILIGEFLQLQPVPNLFDEGHFMFFSPLFDPRGPRMRTEIHVDNLR